MTSFIEDIIVKIVLAFLTVWISDAEKNAQVQAVSTQWKAAVTPEDRSNARKAFQSLLS